MLEANVIQTKGFKNVVQDGRTIGFQVRVRCSYYRGIWASLLERVEVTVDGERFLPEHTRLGLHKRTATLAELADDAETRWLYEEPMVVMVDKPGGLTPGMHHVQVLVTWRWSYIPVEFQPTTNIAEQQLVLVQ